MPPKTKEPTEAVVESHPIFAPEVIAAFFIGFNVIRASTNVLQPSAAELQAHGIGLSISLIALWFMDMVLKHVIKSAANWKLLHAFANFGVVCFALNVGLICSLNPNTAAIEIRTNFSSSISLSSFLSSSISSSYLSSSSLSSSSLSSSSSSSLDNTYIWIIPTSTRPSLDLRSPSAGLYLCFYRSTFNMSSSGISNSILHYWCVTFVSFNGLFNFTW